MCDSASDTHGCLAFSLCVEGAHAPIGALPNDFSSIINHSSPFHPPLPSPCLSISGPCRAVDNSLFFPQFFTAAPRGEDRDRR